MRRMLSKMLAVVMFVMLLPVSAKANTAQRWEDEPGIKHMSAGGFYTSVIKTDGTLWAWGEIGNGTTEDQHLPVQVGTDKNWENVSTGWGHSVALKTDGTLWAWGSNETGQLGDGTTENRYEPVQIGADTDWKSISAGAIHTMAIKNDGTLWAWGANWGGQLGDGTTEDRHLPVQVGTDKKWINVSANIYQAAAITIGGELFVWGLDISAVPVQMGSDNDWVSVAVGLGHTMAIKEDKSLWGVGSNIHGELASSTSHNELIQVGGDKNWISVSAGWARTMALKEDGSLWAWGCNTDGQLGIGTLNYDSNSVPLQVDAFSEWSNVITYNHHTIALKADGSLWAWGQNYFGQLGDGTTEDRYSPVCIWSPPPPPGCCIDYRADDIIATATDAAHRKFAINLTTEALTIPADFTAAAYSTNGGAKWKNIKPEIQAQTDDKNPLNSLTSKNKNNF
ncbi:MAG: hypothetical protein FWH04_02785, partial [Oscillospiraceae bacterium]|nr:hypothetical protein [Oscillospiraceae bacterium]